MTAPHGMYEAAPCPCPDCTLRREADQLKTHERRIAALEATVARLTKEALLKSELLP
jgi:hypothetical protein